MNEVEVVEVSKDRTRVTVRAMNVMLTFVLDASGKLRIASRTKRGAHDREALLVPRFVYQEACRRAGAILREARAPRRAPPETEKKKSARDHRKKQTRPRSRRIHRQLRLVF